MDSKDEVRKLREEVEALKKEMSAYARRQFALEGIAIHLAKQVELFGRLHGVGRADDLLQAIDALELQWKEEKAY